MFYNYATNYAYLCRNFKAVTLNAVVSLDVAIYKPKIELLNLSLSGAVHFIYI